VASAVRSSRLLSPARESAATWGQIIGSISGVLASYIHLVSININRQFFGWTLQFRVMTPRRFCFPISPVLFASLPGGCSFPARMAARVPVAEAKADRNKRRGRVSSGRGFKQDLAIVITGPVEVGKNNGSDSYFEQFDRMDSARLYRPSMWLRCASVTPHDPP